MFGSRKNRDFKLIKELIRN